MTDHGTRPVEVWFTEPQWGRDPHTRDAFRSDRHIVFASLVVQDEEVTRLLDSEGEIVAEWRTAIVHRVHWSEPRPSIPELVERAVLEAEQEAEQHEVESQEDLEAWRAKVLGRHPRAWESWSDEEDDQLRTEFAARKAVKTMALAHERTPGAIRARLQRLGLSE